MGTEPAVAFVTVCSVALFVSTLTLFSGFGLGTLLMPAFAAFFPLPVAIAATAAVHFANDAFKAILTGRKASWPVVLRFALPAALAAIAGAWLLTFLSERTAITSYHIGTHECRVTAVKLAIASVMLCFACIELFSSLDRFTLGTKWLPLGGTISGFFGGLSGHQGALRTAFLARCELTKEQLIGTGAICSVLVDAVRLAMYALAAAGLLTASNQHSTAHNTPLDSWSTILQDTQLRWLVLAACIAAFIGSFFGSRLVKKVTLKSLRTVIGTMLIVVAALLAAGIV